MKRIFRSVFALVLVCCTLLAIPATANAAGGTVTYDGKAQKFIFEPGSSYSPTDLFTNDFKGVMPGDHITETIEIKNTNLFAKHIKVYMRALGAQRNTDDFLHQMTLTVKQSGKSSDLFKAPADQTAQLTDWVLLGTVYRGGKITLEVTLDVPIEMDNEFANKIGYLDWEFKVEEIPHDPDAPKTGDTFPLMILISVMTVSLAALVILFVYTKKRKAR